MIDVRDLMLGNYVGDRHGNTCCVLSVGELNITVSSLPTGYKTNAGRNHFSPILITPEWLKDFGFTSDLDNLWTYKDFSIFPFFIEDNDTCYSLYISHIDAKKSRVWLVDCNYVHELQNLIYALTKQELSLGGEQQCK